MEIDFNTGRIPAAESKQQIARKAAAPEASAAVSFSASDSLKSQLNNLSSVRPEVVSKAKQLAADSSYPPDFVLDRVAVLLAVNANTSTTSQSGQIG